MALPIPIADGEMLNNVFAQGTLNNNNVMMTPVIPGVPLRETPSDPGFAVGVDDSITQQGRRVSCSIQPNGDLLIVADNNGSGLLLPYLGTGSPHAPVGVAVTPNRGLGTYTIPVEAGGPVTWVCTGKFSGCSSFSIRNAVGGNNLVFGHLITPSAGYTADTVPNQAANIQNQTGYNAATVDQHVVTPPPDVAADGGYVFWMQTNQGWVRRQIWVFGNLIRQIENPHAI